MIRRTVVVEKDLNADERWVARMDLPDGSTEPGKSFDSRAKADAFALIWAAATNANVELRS